MREKPNRVLDSITCLLQSTYHDYKQPIAKQHCVKKKKKANTQKYCQRFHTKYCSMHHPWITIGLYLFQPIILDTNSLDIRLNWISNAIYYFSYMILIFFVAFIVYVIIRSSIIIDQLMIVICLLRMNITKRWIFLIWLHVHHHGKVTQEHRSPSHQKLYFEFISYIFNLCCWIKMYLCSDDTIKTPSM